MASGIPQQERQALFALYRYTGGENWRRRDGWLSTTDPDYEPWYGVTCEEGHVTHLSLPANTLQGSIPPQLGQLTRLVELDLGDNQLQGPLPPQLGHLRQLVQLNLANNQLRGPLPQRLRLLIHLQMLDLHGNRFSGPLPPFLSDLTHLTQLNLSNNQFQGSIPPQWGRLDALEELNLSHNPLTGPLPHTFIQLSHLTVLRFGETELSEPGDEAFQNWIRGRIVVERNGHIFFPSGRPNIPWWVTFAELSAGGSIFALVWLLSLPVVGPGPGLILALAGSSGAHLAARRLRPAPALPMLPAPRQRWTSEQLAERLQGEIDSLRNRAPQEVIQQAESLQQLLLEVLPRIPDINQGDRDIYLVRQTILDYLPEALAAYRALPPAEAATRPIRHGRTAQQHLIEQLQLMERGIRQIESRLSYAPTQQLLSLGRFLEERFDENKTDLPDDTESTPPRLPKPRP